MISASHPGTLFLSSQEMGCAQIILMKRASKNGVIIDLHKSSRQKMIINTAIFTKGEPFIDPLISLFISELFYGVY